MVSFETQSEKFGHNAGKLISTNDLSRCNPEQQYDTSIGRFKPNTTSF